MRSPSIRGAPIDPLAQDVIVVKLGYLTPELQSIAAKSCLALTCGCTDEVLQRLPYTYPWRRRCP